MFPGIVLFLAVWQLTEIIRELFLVLLPEFVIFFAVIVRELPDKSLFFLTAFAVHKSEQDSDDGTGQVRLPRHAARFFKVVEKLFRHHTPNKSSVIERYNQRNREQLHIPAKQSAEKKEKRENIDDSTSANDTHR